MGKIYLLRHNRTFNYIANSIDKRYRTYTPFLEYAMWFETKKVAEKHRLKKSEWINSGQKWWAVFENEKYEKNRVA